MRRRLIKVGVLLSVVSVVFLVACVASNYFKPNETAAGETTAAKGGGGAEIIAVPSANGSAQPAGPVTSVGTVSHSEPSTETMTSGGSVSIQDLPKFAVFTLLSILIGFVGGTSIGCVLGSRDTGVVLTHEKKPPKIDIKDMMIGCMMRQREFTVPGIAEAVKAPEPQVENVVKNLIQRGVVKTTAKVWPAASGSARVYEYMGTIK